MIALRKTICIYNTDLLTVLLDLQSYLVTSSCIIFVNAFDSTCAWDRTLFMIYFETTQSIFFSITRETLTGTDNVVWKSLVIFKTIEPQLLSFSFVIRCFSPRCLLMLQKTNILDNGSIVAAQVLYLKFWLYVDRHLFFEVLQDCCITRLVDVVELNVDKLDGGFLQKMVQNFPL